MTEPTPPTKLPPEPLSLYFLELFALLFMFSNGAWIGTYIGRAIGMTGHGILSAGIFLGTLALFITGRCLWGPKR